MGELRRHGAVPPAPGPVVAVYAEAVSARRIIMRTKTLWLAAIAALTLTGLE
jgi:hypothetical protein